MRIESKNAVNTAVSSGPIELVSDSSSITGVVSGSYLPNANIGVISSNNNGQNIQNLVNSHLHHGPVRMPVKVSNVINNHQLTDTLHQRSKPLSCTGHYCVGALMAGQSKPEKSTRTRGEVLEQAVDFFEQYFIHLKKHSSGDLSNRLAEVTAELDRTGTYTLTPDELQFGVKTAWRNAPRCIGRIQWNKLELHDARHVRTTKEMFEAICKHLERATNGGNLRSSITLFPQRVPGREDFRVWSPQFLGFAGYLQPDGSIIGDPARVQFTRICQRLGWKGKGGRFDVLPIVISAPGEGVKFYEIPEELILLVDLEHPQYEWFKEMGLKWYALPAVADMLFDCGGLEFTAAPFNGWYMGTEIGARNFCDPQRYNLTEEFGKKMGLDTSSLSNLWKDQVLVQVNIAVLHSFQKKGVTIVDHHTASESFIKHMHTETRTRGGCPADWVWIVPPMSSSVTSVFHQEMINYNLKPSYEYQEKAWKTHQWGNSNVQLKYKFSSVAKAAFWVSLLMKKVLSKRTKATILYATETGKSETFAQKLGKLMHSSFFVQVQSMEEYDMSNLEKESLVIAVVSTFGNGEAPDNGKDFYKGLYKMKQEKTVTLSKLKYGVFALGSTQYPTFCSFGKNVDKMLHDLGGESVVPIGLGDELRGQEQVFHTWAQEMYKTCCQSFNLNVDQKELEEANFVDETVYEPERVRIKEVGEDAVTAEQHVVHELSRIHKKKVFPCKVLSRIRLLPIYSDRQTLLVRLNPSNQITRSLFVYQPGDHLGVYPSNPSELVDALLGHLRRSGYDEPDSTMLQVELMNDGKWASDPRLPPCTLRIALTNYLDITSPPSPKFLGYLEKMANDGWDIYRLKKLAHEVDDYERWRSFNNPNMLDVLSEFPSVHLDPEFLLTQLPLLQPRYYSISSALSVNPEEVHLTMSLVNYRVHEDKGPKKFGVCTSFFDRFPAGDVACFFRSAPGFRLPENKACPVIMIGAGSGVAPFRSFWQERENQVQNGAKCGKMILFFGCRQEKVDNIYSSELDTLTRKGVIHEVFLALSREPGHKKRYVQDEVYIQRALIFWLVQNEEAHIYVCGDAVMADGVRKAMKKVIESEGKLNTEDAEARIDQLLNQGRYHEDVFGAVHRY